MLEHLVHVLILVYLNLKKGDDKYKQSKIYIKYVYS